jgi:hypothetical protein
MRTPRASNVEYEALGTRKDFNGNFGGLAEILFLACVLAQVVEKNIIVCRRNFVD